MVAVVLYRPEIAGNVGTVLRTGACMGVPVHLVEPMGFAWDDARVRRAAMDYIDHVTVVRHCGWDSFRAAVPGRLVLMTTKATTSLFDHRFDADDLLLFGRESDGVPDEVAACAGARLRLPMRAGVRSLNLAVSAALATVEALRQTKGLPE